MLKTVLSLLAALTLAAGATTPARASVLDTQTHPTASTVAPYGVFHDGITNFVFLKLPEGWRFVARDDNAHSHDVFLDVSTGFVFVKLADGWKFVGRNG